MIASWRGGNGCLWFGLGILFGPFGLAFAFLAGEEQVPRGCCQKKVSRKALKCPFRQTIYSGLSGHLKTGHTWTLKNRPTEQNQNKTIYSLGGDVRANILV